MTSFFKMMWLLVICFIGLNDRMSLGLAYSSEMDCGLLDWEYQSDIEVLAQPWDTTQEIYVDFTYLLKKAKGIGEFDEGSLRMVVVDAMGNDWGDSLPITFVKDHDYDLKKGAGGRIIWRVAGERDEAHALKKYRIYFNVKGKNPVVPLKPAGGIQEANLVPNVGFEYSTNRDGVPDRTPYFGKQEIRENLRLDSTVRHSGKYSVKMMVNTGAEIDFLVTPDVAYKEEGRDYCLRVKSCEIYLFEIFCKGSSCANPKYKRELVNGIYLIGEIFWYDTAKGLIYSPESRLMFSKILPIGQAQSWDWSLINQKVAMPQGARYARFRISFPVEAGTVWVDDPVIRLASPVEVTNCKKKNESSTL